MQDIEYKYFTSKYQGEGGTLSKPANSKTTAATSVTTNVDDRSDHKILFDSARA
jgi:hypothetical protein